MSKAQTDKVKHLARWTCPKCGGLMRPESVTWAEWIANEVWGWRVCDRCGHRVPDTPVW